MDTCICFGVRFFLCAILICHVYGFWQIECSWFSCCSCATSSNTQQTYLQGTESENKMSDVSNSSYCHDVHLPEMEADLLRCGNFTSFQKLQIEDLQTEIFVLKNLSVPHNLTSLTKDQLEIQLKKLKKEIAIDKKNTTLYRSKKRCALDNRKSARNLGILGCIVLVLPLILIVANDLLKVFVKYYNELRDIINV